MGLRGMFRSVFLCGWGLFGEMTAGQLELGRLLLFNSNFIKESRFFPFAFRFTWLNLCLYHSHSLTKKQ
jgi:hypothetical protein